jgi:hypothetical protein
MDSDLGPIAAGALKDIVRTRSFPQNRTESRCAWSRPCWAAAGGHSNDFTPALNLVFD